MYMYKYAFITRYQHVQKNKMGGGLKHIGEQRNTYRVLGPEDVGWVNVAQDRTSGRLLCI
jgi:hypothetical protein